jgi:hypothetical protein
VNILTLSRVDNLKGAPYKTNGRRFHCIRDFRCLTVSAFVHCIFSSYVNSVHSDLPKVKRTQITAEFANTLHVKPHPRLSNETAFVRFVFGCLVLVRCIKVNSCSGVDGDKQRSLSSAGMILDITHNGQKRTLKRCELAM